MQAHSLTVPAQLKLVLSIVLVFSQVCFSLTTGKHTILCTEKLDHLMSVVQGMFLILPHWDWVGTLMGMLIEAIQLILCI